MKKSSVRFSEFLMGAASILALFAVGCGSGAAPGGGALDKATLTSDSRYMASIFDRRTTGEPFMHIDLADDRQYHALVNRLLTSGNTPETSPHLFEKLSEDRKAALGRVTQEPGTGLGTASLAFTGPAWCGHMVPVSESVIPGMSTYVTNPQVSCFGGNEYTYADISGYEANQNESTMNYLGFNAGEEYGGGMDFSTVTLASNINYGALNKLFADSYVIAFDSQTGQSQYTYVVLRTTSSAVPGPSFSPGLKPAGPPVSTPVNCLTNVHPRDLIDDPSTTSDNNVTRICLERGIVNGNLDCDYATVDASLNPVWVNAPSIYGMAGVSKTQSLAQIPPKWIAQATVVAPEPFPLTWPVAPAVYDTSKMYVPLRGSYESNPITPNTCKIKSYVTASTIASVYLVQAGGWCAGGKTAGDLAGQTNIVSGFPTPNGTSSKSQLNLLGNFGPDCTSYQQKARLIIQITAKVSCDGVTQVDKVCTTVSQPIDFKNSCFAEGTRITRADGTSDIVEHIVVGDKVRANNEGLVLTVASVARGAERHPLINLYDDQGHNLLLTEKHPVVTATRGIIFADKVVEGDQVQTAHGIGTIIAISRTPYDREVFNLSLGTQEELAKVRPEDRTMFADGIRVGDGAMQWEMESQPKPRPSDVLSRISPVWHKDYLNHQARLAKIIH